MKKNSFDFELVEMPVVYSNPNDCGAFGKNFELFFRKLVQSVNTKQSNKVASANMTDIIFYHKDKNGKRHRVGMECKTGAGELAKIDYNGNVEWKPFLSNDFVVYCPRPDHTKVYIMTPTEFLNAIHESELFRAAKESTAQSKAKGRGEFHYYNRVSIQSFIHKDSTASKIRWYNTLEKYGHDFTLDIKKHELTIY